MQKINNFYKKNLYFAPSGVMRRLKISNFSPVIFLSFIAFFSIIYFSTSSLFNKKNIKNKKNLTEVVTSSEFSNLTNYLVSKINNPYEEVNYIIENNDTIEKILKKYNIKNEDIKKISQKLIEKKLSSIYSGRKLTLIYKKLDNNINTIVNFVYPVSNTSSVEIRKTKESFEVKENILELYKKEVVKD